MPVHSIPTSAGDAVCWYERSGCIAYRGRLYFMVDVGFNHCHTLLAGAVNGELTPGAVIYNEPEDAWRDDRWPVPDFSIGFQLISAAVAVPDYRTCCFFMCERGAPRRLATYVDQINPAFKRVQRWFRQRVWRRRVEQRLQFALATHSWLADDVVRVIGVFIG